MSEGLRQLASISTKIVAVVDHDMLPYLEEKWKKMPAKLRPLDSFFARPEKAKSVTQMDTFLEFVEKQVIMDVLFEPYIQKYFVQHETFPFSAEGMLG